MAAIPASNAAKQVAAPTSSISYSMAAKRRLSGAVFSIIIFSVGICRLKHRRVSDGIHTDMPRAVNGADVSDRATVLPPFG